MSNTNTGGPAFPAPEAGQQHYGDPAAYTGMTLRDYFAAKAMHAIYTSLYEYEFTGSARARQPEFVQKMEELAVDAYGLADAMLKARE
jgi:hypothetical protein